MKRFAFVLFAVVMGGVSRAMSNPGITVPLRERGPVVDGVIGGDEWRDSVTLSGFLKTKPMGLVAETGGEGTVSLACDGREFYLAFQFAARNNDPGGGLGAAHPDVGLSERHEARRSLGEGRAVLSDAAARTSPGRHLVDGASDCVGAGGKALCGRTRADHQVQA